MKNKFGGSIVSNHILDRSGKIKWVFREESVNVHDNGWRFMADNDDDEYIQNPKNSTICVFEEIVKMEPLIAKIFDLPVGTELELIYSCGKKVLVSLN